MSERLALMRNKYPTLKRDENTGNGKDNREPSHVIQSVYLGCASISPANKIVPLSGERPLKTAYSWY